MVSVVFVVHDNIGSINLSYMLTLFSLVSQMSVMPYPTCIPMQKSPMDMHHRPMNHHMRWRRRILFYWRMIWLTTTMAGRIHGIDADLMHCS